MNAVLEVFRALGGFGNDDDDIVLINELKNKMESLEKKYGYFD